MTKEKMILALAELDGWLDCKEYTFEYSDPFDGEGKIVMKLLQGRNPDSLGVLRTLKPYLTSRDAIISLVEKLINRHTCHSFFDALGLIAIKDWQDIDGAPHYEGDGSYFELWVLFKATPQQIAEALLRATGKWTEEGEVV